MKEKANEDKAEGSLSDTAIGSFSDRIESQVEQSNANCNPSTATTGVTTSRNSSGLTKKSSSTSQLSVSGKCLYFS
jgi:hypothetical protein